MILIHALFAFYLFEAKAFILIDPDYRLKDPSKVVLNIASGGCTANGITNGELEELLQESLDNYWNTVSESRLYIEMGGEVGTGINEDPPAGEIVVGCQALGVGGASGIANINSTKDGCRVRLNGSTFVPGGYLREGIMSTIIHEIGHCVGLNHSNDSASVMTYNTTDFLQAKHLSRDDVDGVIYLYPYESKALAFGSCSALASDKARDTANDGLNLFSLLLGLLMALTFRYFFRKKFHS